jgi:hypothetical protein
MAVSWSGVAGEDVGDLIVGGKTRRTCRGDLNRVSSALVVASVDENFLPGC